MRPNKIKKFVDACESGYIENMEILATFEDNPISKYSLLDTEVREDDYYPQLGLLDFLKDAITTNYKLTVTPFRYSKNSYKLVLKREFGDDYVVMSMQFLILKKPTYIDDVQRYIDTILESIRSIEEKDENLFAKNGGESQTSSLNNTQDELFL